MKSSFSLFVFVRWGSCWWVSDYQCENRMCVIVAIKSLWSMNSNNFERFYIKITIRPPNFSAVHYNLFWKPHWYRTLFTKLIEKDLSFCRTSLKISIGKPELKKTKKTTTTKTPLTTYTKWCLGLILVKRHYN